MKTNTQLNELLNQHMETDEKPRLVEIFVDGKTYQNAFCYSMIAVPETAKYSKMLSCVISGPDSTLQSMKAAIDGGTYGFSFGYGEKGTHSYQFFSEVHLLTEKGKYNYFPITVNNRKVFAIVHDDILEGKYMMSFEENPAQDLRSVLGGRQFGLPLLEEWAEPFMEEMKTRGYLEPVPMYYDQKLFSDGFHMMELKMVEEEADQLLSEMIANNRLSFPIEGTGACLAETDGLESYMLSYSDDMLEKISADLTPDHDPMTDPVFEHFDSYDTKLFPVQGHVATAIAKRMQKQKSVILQGEMSTGKSKMMTAIADAYARMKGKKGFHAVLMVPPNLTDKWSHEEIYDLLPNPRSKVILIQSTSELIEYHQAWTKQGRPKPEVPTFFVVSFTTMRSDASIEPVVSFEYKKTKKQKTNAALPYRYGYMCPSCGHAHQVIESTSTIINESGEEEISYEKRAMEEDEFGTSRRVQSSIKPANAFCSECGDSLWKRNVPTRYKSFKEWAGYEKALIQAIEQGDKFELIRVRKAQPEIAKKQGSPRRIATIEYIRRKMNKFFDVAIIDEVHELKGGGTAQGNALGSLAAASKRVIAGTGTLFGGKASDIYYLLWRLFPYEMVKAGYKYSEINKWNYEFGNVEKTTYSRGGNDDTEYTNKQSRGGLKPPTEKVLPGISPFVFGKFLLQNTVLVRLLDVWPDPVELVNVPTILVDMNEEMKETYADMKNIFETTIDANRGKDGKFSNLWLLYTETGIAFPDNPFRYPAVRAKTKTGEKELIWEPASYLDEEVITPKEEKLIEIAKDELQEKRPLIVYVRDTGSSNADRDIQPRLKKILEENVEGAKVAILRTNTTKTDQRSHWLKKKVESEGHNIVIVSMELVKVGLDLLCTPTLVFYQFSWSMFTMGQASRRSWRIGQTRECRLYYLAYRDSFQEQMATLVAMKSKASGAINGDVSSDGLNAMLGDEGDLQSMLIKSVKEGTKLEGSSEAWIATTTDRAREILNNIGKSKAASTHDVIAQLIQWARTKKYSEMTLDTIRTSRDLILTKIQQKQVDGFSVKDGVLIIDEFFAFGFGGFSESDVISHVLSNKPKQKAAAGFTIKIIESKSVEKKKGFVEGQLALDLFA